MTHQQTVLKKFCKKLKKLNHAENYKKSWGGVPTASANQHQIRSHTYADEFGKLSSENTFICENKFIFIKI